MRKSYVKPLLEVCQTEITQRFALLSGGQNTVLDWDNVDGDVWGNFK